MVSNGVITGGNTFPGEMMAQDFSPSSATLPFLPIKSGRKRNINHANGSPLFMQNREPILPFLYDIA